MTPCAQAAARQQPALGGIYFPALELTETVSLRLFTDELIRFSGSPVPPFRDWLDALPYLFWLAGDRVVPVVIDEFPFLVKASSSLPLIIQREGGSSTRTRVHLVSTHAVDRPRRAAGCGHEGETTVVRMKEILTGTDRGSSPADLATALVRPSRDS